MVVPGNTEGKAARVAGGVAEKGLDGGEYFGRSMLGRGCPEGVTLKEIGARRVLVGGMSPGVIPM